MQLFGIPVMVRPSFFFWTVLLGLLGSRDAASIAVWVAVVFVSVLVHELGHGLTARYYGQSPWIVLHGFGGTTAWPPSARFMSLRQQLVVVLAGPGAGFLLGGLVLAVTSLAPTASSPLARALVTDLLVVNFGFGLLNLLPILPLDGGQAMRIFAVRFFPHLPRVPWLVTAVVGVVVAGAAWAVDMYMLAVLSGMLGFTAVRRMLAMPGELPREVRRRATRVEPRRVATPGELAQPSSSDREAAGEGGAPAPPRTQTAQLAPVQSEDPVKLARAAFIRAPSVEGGEALVAALVAARRYSMLAAVAAGPDGVVITGASLLGAAEAAMGAGVPRGAIELGELAHTRGAPAAELLSRAYAKVGEHQRADEWAAKAEAN